MSHQASLSIRPSPTASEVLRWPLPHQRGANGALIRSVALLARRQVLSIRGLEHVAPAHDPFILAINHSTRAEAVLVPTLLMLYRGGRLIHFVADWNFSLIPGLGLIYSRAETVLVTNKSARPSFLNVLKPRYTPPSALARAYAHLSAGRSIGIFPEGRVNRHPRRLLDGRRGAALLSLKSGAAIVPAGIRFPRADPTQPISDAACMEVEIGAPLLPTGSGARPTLADVRAWHATVMGEIGRLSRKSWVSPAEEIGDAH